MLRRVRRMVLAALILAAPVPAATLTAAVGTLGTCSSGTCPTGATDNVQASGAKILVFQYTSTVVPYIKLQACFLHSQADCDANGGAGWVDVIGSGSSTTGYAGSITDPAGLYRANVVSCAVNCTYTIAYRLVNQK